MKSIETVNNLLPGESGIIKKIIAIGNIKRRLMDMGIIEGVTVKMVRAAPLDDPVEIRVLNTLLALRRSEACLLIIDRYGERPHVRKAIRHRFGRKSKQRKNKPI